MTSFRARARSKARPGPADRLDHADQLALEIGPPPRVAARPDWPASEARLAVLWTLHRNEALAEWAATFLPWAMMRFDVPTDARRPGPIRAELIRRGTIPPLTAAVEDATAAYTAPDVLSRLREPAAAPPPRKNAARGRPRDR